MPKTFDCWHFTVMSIVNRIYLAGIPEFINVFT